MTSHPAKIIVNLDDTKRLEWLFSELDTKAICLKIGLIADVYAMGSWLNKPISYDDWRGAIDKAMERSQ